MKRPEKTMNDWTLPAINLNLCTQCGICAAVCPEQALDMVNGEPVFTHPQRCTYCTLCESSCPVGAIQRAFTISWEEKTTGGNSDE
ncbi:MAG TPA: 4Fe-4S dicluster domain-containing protein [Chloroflexi bacterium]|nr:4Fe-4S dicluster domain-containing protein [Chloroflexota bacterium]